MKRKSNSHDPLRLGFTKIDPVDFRDAKQSKKLLAASVGYEYLYCTSPIQDDPWDFGDS